MDESWTGALSLIGGLAVGYVAHYLQARTPTKDNDRTLEDSKARRAASKRTEALEHFRWAAELAVSAKEPERELGVDQLVRLVRNPYPEEQDVRLVRSAVRSALAHRLQPWETDGSSTLRTDEEGS